MKPKKSAPRALARLFMLALLAAFLLAAAGFAWLLWAAGPPRPPGVAGDGRRPGFFTFLIVGLNEGANANTVMVASLDGASGEAHLISIPRDSLLNVSRGNRKLSSSYMVGAGGGRGAEGGVRQMQAEVSALVGFVPDFYVVIDYDAFFAIIDAVGGIEVYVPMRMRYTDPSQDLRIDIQPGLQHMDSRTALDFARFRQADPGYPSPPRSDYFRIESQQAVVAAVLERMLRPASIPRIPEFARIFDESVRTDLTAGNLTWLAQRMWRGGGVTAHTMPTSGTSGPPRWYEIIDAQRALELVNGTVNPFLRDIRPDELDIVSE